jgi:hypothetical protein
MESFHPKKNQKLRIRFLVAIRADRKLVFVRR